MDRFLVLMFLLMGINPSIYAEEVLFTAEYQGEYSGMTIKSTRRLIAQDGGQYRFESVIKNAFASIIEKSLFNLHEGIIVPQRYHFKRKVLSFKADETIDFDWNKGIAQYRRKKKENKNRDHEISPGVLDPALYQLQIQRDLYSQNDKLSYAFVKSNKVKNMLFTTKEKETLRVGKNQYEALKVERVNLDDNSQTRLWVVPELDFLIAKIEHIEENGESYSINLTALSRSPDLVEIFYRSNPSSTLNHKNTRLER